jgi:hypothetical protein
MILKGVHMNVPHPTLKIGQIPGKSMNFPLGGETSGFYPWVQNLLPPLGGETSGSELS